MFSFTKNSDKLQKFLKMFTFFQMQGYFLISSGFIFLQAMSAIPSRSESNLFMYLSSKPSRELFQIYFVCF